MQKYLVEVPHDPDVKTCANVVHIFLASGSHFLSQADWGCRDGIHSAWMVIEANDKEEVRNIIPPSFRSHARIVGLNKFTMEEVEDLMSLHHA